MVELLLPRTDAGAFAQLVGALAIGIPLFVWTVRRGVRDLIWFVGGTLVLLLGFFAIRTMH